MSVAAQSPRTPDASGGPWPGPEQLEVLAPIVRLLSAIGSIPRVTRIGVTVTDPGIDLWVFMDEEDYESEALVSRAERAYLTAVKQLKFELHVIAGASIDASMLPPYTVVFER